jgi:hypothetical protein
MSVAKPNMRKTIPRILYTWMKYVEKNLKLKIQNNLLDKKERRHLPNKERLNKLNDNDEAERDKNKSKINEQHETTDAS